MIDTLYAAKHDDRVRRMVDLGADRSAERATIAALAQGGVSARRLALVSVATGVTGWLFPATDGFFRWTPVQNELFATVLGRGTSRRSRPCRPTAAAGRRAGAPDPSAAGAGPPDRAVTRIRAARSVASPIGPSARPIGTAAPNCPPPRFGYHWRLGIVFPPSRP